MADWTDPPWAQLVAGKPWTDEKAAAAFENVIAVTEGADDAPRIRGNAMATAADLPLTVTAADTYSVLLGHGIVNGSATSSAYSYVVAATLTVISLTGTVRYAARHAGTSEAADIDMRVLKNGVEVAAWTMDSTSYVTRSSDIPVVPGDVIEWQHRGNMTSMSNFLLGVITASNGYFERIAIGVEVP